MSDNRYIDKDYSIMAESLIASDPDLQWINDTELRIGFLASDCEKKRGRKLVLGECEKVAQKWQWCCPYDFIITIYDPNTQDLDRDQLRILLKHELLHIGYDAESENDPYYIVPHDIEDFESIINQYGMHWDNIKEVHDHGC